MNNIDQELSFVAISDDEASTIQGGVAPLVWAGVAFVGWLLFGSPIKVS